MYYIPEEEVIFIPYTTPSSKNGRGVSRTGHSFPSKQTTKWKKLTKPFFLEAKSIFENITKNKQWPLLIGFHYVRGKDDLYDWINPMQTIQDELVHYGWFNDDNVYQLFPFPFQIQGKFTSYDKNYPGVYIKILNQQYYYDI